MLTTWRVHNRHSLHGFTAQKVLAPFHWRIFPCIPSRSESKSKLLGPRPWQDFYRIWPITISSPPKFLPLKDPHSPALTQGPTPPARRRTRTPRWQNNTPGMAGVPPTRRAGSVRWDFRSHCMTPVIQVMTRVFVTYLLGLWANWSSG